MRAHHVGHGPGMAAPEAAASLRPAGAASAVADGVAPAELKPQKESAPVAQATQSREQNEHADCASDASAHKSFGTLRNEFALRGYVLDRTGDGGYAVSRWSLSRRHKDLDSVVQFLRTLAP